MALREYWLRWKALRLPWRKKFLVGFDLNQNQYWEFKDALSSNPNRMRRIVKSPRRVHHSDVQAQISPLWHQWLRHTRLDPPSLQEQQMDVQRQITLKHNAMLADERWNAKKKYIESPAAAQTPQDTEPNSSAPRHEMERQAGLSHSQETSTANASDPWQQERERQQNTAANPGNTWQPDSWTPPASKR